MNTFSIGESLRFGWNAFKQRPWFLMGVLVGLMTVSFLVSLIGDVGEDGIDQFVWLLFIPLLVVNVFIEIAMTKLWLEAHDRLEEMELSSLWMPKIFFTYLAAQILVALVVLFGFLLLIIPGIVFALMLMFTAVSLVDRNLGPIEAMKESRRITKGHRWQLLGFWIVVILLNMAGAIAFGVGLLVTVPVTMIAFVHVYRTLAGQALEHKAHEVVPAADATPAPEPSA